MGVDVAARTCNSFMAPQTVASRERAHSVTVILCDTSADDDDDVDLAAVVADAAAADDDAAAADEAAATA